MCVTTNDFRYFLLPVLLLAALFLHGCDQAPGTQPSPDSTADSAQSVRLVSLAPALTQMVVDLGLGDLLVGVARNDNAAPPNLPIVGDIMSVNTEALLAVKPTHVLLMITKEGVPASLREMATRNKFQILTFPSPKTIEDVGMVLFDEQELFADAPHKGSPSLGAALGVALRASRIKLHMLMRLALLSEVTAQAPRRHVLLVIGTNPLMVVGPGVVHQQLLGSINASNAAGDATVEAPTFDREKLLAAAPDVILFLLPKAPPLGSLADDSRLAEFKGLDIPAVRNKRIVLVNDPLVQLPSSSLARIAAEMAKAIHPELKEKIDQAMAADLTVHQASAASPASAPAVTSPSQPNHVGK